MTPEEVAGTLILHLRQYLAPEYINPYRLQTLKNTLADAIREACAVVEREERTRLSVRVAELERENNKRM